MPAIDHAIETKISRSIRARQMESAFDVPAQEKCSLHWKGDLPIEAEPWNIGLIVGPSGCGKSSLLSHVFGAQKPLTWGAPSVIDDFAAPLFNHELDTRIPPCRIANRLRNDDLPLARHARHAHDCLLK